jgi:hypothetical protein
LTLLFTKFRSSFDPATISGRNATNASSSASLSWTASEAMSEKAARLTNSARRELHCAAFAYACGVRTNRFEQT